MAKSERVKTGSAGVYWREMDRLDGKGKERCYYIMYRQGGRDSKLIEEPVGRASEGMTERLASEERLLRMRGKSLSNEARREQVKQEELARKREQDRAVSFAHLWEIYRAAHAGNSSMRGDVNRYNREIAPVFGEMAASEITARHVSDFRQRLERKGLAPQTVKHALGQLKRVFRYAVSQGYDLKEPAFDMPKVDNKKTETMTDGQLAAYWKALDAEPDQGVAAFYKMALLTGMRMGALCALKWSDIDFGRGMIRLCREAAKNGKEAYIPLNDPARAVLEGIARTSEYVFPGIDGGKRRSPPRMGRRLRDLAGLPKDFRPVHALRHVFASQLASSGQVDIYTLQRLLTHESPMMTERYAHLADEALKRASSVAGSLVRIAEAQGDGVSGRENGIE